MSRNGPTSRYLMSLDYIMCADDAGTMTSGNDISGGPDQGLSTSGRVSDTHATPPDHSGSSTAPGPGEESGHNDGLALISTSVGPGSLKFVTDPSSLGTSYQYVRKGPTRFPAYCPVNEVSRMLVISVREVDSPSSRADKAKFIWTHLSKAFRSVRTPGLWFDSNYVVKSRHWGCVDNLDLPNSLTHVNYWFESYFRDEPYKKDHSLSREENLRELSKREAQQASLQLVKHLTNMGTWPKAGGSRAQYEDEISLVTNRLAEAAEVMLFNLRMGLSEEDEKEANQIVTGNARLL